MGKVTREDIRKMRAARAYEYYDKRIQELNQTITDLQVELARYKSADSLTKTAAPAPVDSLQ